MTEAFAQTALKVQPTTVSKRKLKNGSKQKQDTS